MKEHREINNFFQDCTHLLCSCLSSHSLPKVVKRRVNALKNLQVKCAHIEAKFYEEVHELERKYAALYQPLFDKVSNLYIVSGCAFQYFYWISAALLFRAPF